MAALQKFLPTNYSKDGTYSAWLVIAPECTLRIFPDWELKDFDLEQL